MKIRTVEYAGTVATAGGEVPGDLPQVAFSGRSNVGKSSLINTLLRRTRSKIARVSGTPGKTQALNFYRVNDRFFLLDLPGFGYAKVPKSMRDQWKGLIEGYLARDVDVRGVVHLVDARRDPAPQDLQMLDFLARLQLPTLIVLTKIDKLKRGERQRAVQRAAASLGVESEQLLPFSSKTGEGREALLQALDELLQEEGAGGGSEQDQEGDAGTPEGPETRHDGAASGPGDPVAPEPTSDAGVFRPGGGGSA